MTEYRWYKIVNGKDPIEQGDLVNSCPIIIPLSDIEEGSKEEITLMEDVRQFLLKVCKKIIK